MLAGYGFRLNAGGESDAFFVNQKMERSWRIC
jgi:hypothetical protein